MALYIGGGSRQKGNICIIANTDNIDEILGEISSLISGESIGVTLQQLKTQIKNINALAIANLAKKGVVVSKNATTYEIMQKIADIKYEIEDNTSIDENGVVVARINIDSNGIIFGDISIDDNNIVSL